MKKYYLLLTAMYLLFFTGGYAQDVYYKVVDGIPYLPVLSSTQLL